MASASSSAQAAFGLGRRKKNPGLLDQIGMFFGGDKKRKSKGSFRALSPATQKASATSPRKRGAENAVVHFFRTIVSPAPPKSRGNQKSQSAKAKKASGDGKGTLTRIFKMGPQTELAAGVNILTEGNDQQGQTPEGSRSASPAKR